MLDIDQVSGLRAYLDQLQAKADAAFNPENLPSISEVEGLAAQLGAISPALARGAFAGMLLSNTAGIPAGLTLGNGMVRDSTNTADIVLPAGLSKIISAQWAPGSGAGCRDQAGAFPANSWFHIHAITNPTTGASDWIASQSATNPNLALPSALGFTKSRRIRGWLTDAGGNCYQIRQKPGSYFQKIPRGTEFTGQSAVPAVGSLRQLHVPRGVKVQALCFLQDSSATTTQANLMLLWDPDDGSVPVFGQPTQYAHIRRTSDTPYLAELTCAVWTDANGQVSVASNDAGSVWALGSVGYWDFAETWGV